MRTLSLPWPFNRKWAFVPAEEVISRVEIVDTRGEWVHLRIADGQKPKYDDWFQVGDTIELVWKMTKEEEGWKKTES